MWGERVQTLVGFAAARWGAGRAGAGRERLLAHQQRRLARFFARDLPRAAFYQGSAVRALADLPIVDKTTVLARFADFNRHEVSLDEALAVALAGERSRDFRPTLRGLTVGLSSGTSGARGVFLVSARERARWAGWLLARVLHRGSQRQLLDWRQPPLRVSFFLRANSNLYTTLASSRLRFDFHDLSTRWANHLAALRAAPPDVLVGPPSVLRCLAAAGGLAPRQVIAVAEVLEADDVALLESAFGVAVQQVYQATEGFLGVSCPAGRVHLNEELLVVEPEWLDAERRRFRPLVTDFSRTTQLVARYRLEDVLLDGDGPCPCGRPTRSLGAVLGRADDVLWRPQRVTGVALAVFPDTLRRAFALVGEGLADYRLEARGEVWEVRLRAAAGADLAALERAVGAELVALAEGLEMVPATLQFAAWRDDEPGQKRRRVVGFAP